MAAPHVILVSLDTTRADALSCYGVPPGPYRTETRTTPNLDALAAEGARFERFFAHAPSTLSSHASMLTGRDPHGHDVVRNGFPLDPAVPTLAERLSAEGWDTIAVIAASALEGAMGLDRGFRVYDDEVGGLQGLQYQSPADQVVRRALDALDTRPDRERPVFLLVHLYDPHTPYAPPAEHAARFTWSGYRGEAGIQPVPSRGIAARIRRDAADPADVEHVNGLYLAEVAFMDQQVGVLLQGLEDRGLLERALLVVVGDHGETLADDPLYAWSHGSNVATEVMRVPLIVRGYELPLAERAVIERQAAMSGLPRTIERLVGLEPELGDGLEFTHLLAPGPVDDTDGWPERPSIPAFLEASRPRAAEDPDRWNNLRMHRGVWTGGFGAWSAPFVPEPWQAFSEARLASVELLDALAAMVAGWDEAAGPHRAPEVAPSTTRALKELGYVE